MSTINPTRIAGFEGGTPRRETSGKNTSDMHYKLQARARQTCTINCVFEDSSRLACDAASAGSYSRRFEGSCCLHHQGLFLNGP